MGCVMGRGLKPPSRQLVRCLSAKAAARGDGGAVRPLVRMPPSGRRAGFAAWAADGRLGTFVVTPPEGAPSPRELLRLRLPEEALDRKLAPQASQARDTRLQFSQSPAELRSCACINAAVAAGVYRVNCSSLSYP